MTTNVRRSNSLNIHVVDKALKNDHKKQHKNSKPKLAKPETYHHTPTRAAQGFTLTTTPVVYEKKKTHKLSRPVVELARLQNGGLNLRSPTIVPIIEDRSSSESDRHSVNMPTEDMMNPSRRFSSGNYELFSNAILNPPPSSTKTPISTDSFTRGRPDWAEMDERSNKGLRRMASKLSIKSLNIKHSRRHSTDLSTHVIIPLRVRHDDESTYQGRSGCVPWFHRTDIP